MAILKTYHRPTGSRNLHPYIFSEINIFIAVGKIYALISSAESDELYIEIIYVYFTPSHLKKNAFMKRELCTLFPSRTKRLLVIQIFVAPIH